MLYILNFLLIIFVCSLLDMNEIFALETLDLKIYFNEDFDKDFNENFDKIFGDNCDNNNKF